MNRQKTFIITSLALAVLAAATVIVAFPRIYAGDQPAQKSSQTAEVKKPQPAPTEISYVATPGISSLEQLKKEATGLVTKQSEFGEYVDAINGHKGGTDGKYWSFYVDGKMSDVGAGSYVQKGGEKIVWKFQKL